VLPPSALFTVDSFPLEPIEGTTEKANKIKTPKKNFFSSNYKIAKAFSYCTNQQAISAWYKSGV
jgi:hypothetical protein